jgi:hypothetical protein
LGRLRRIPGFAGLARSFRFAGISTLGVAANAMLHTREVAGSKPAAPIPKGGICRDFLR